MCFMKMETDSKLYEELCKSNKIPIDERIVTAISASSLTGELSLAGTSLMTDACDIIGKLLTKSKVISKLDFSDSLLPQQGLSAILNRIPNSERIHSLQLKGNNINASTTAMLARMIAKSSQIKMLGLEWNNIGICKVAMEQFCNALSRNSCIEVLDLRNNQLDAECALLLANVLRKNITLRGLDIRWNCIEQVGAQYLLSAMEINKSLTSLKLIGNSVPNELVSALELATKHNLSLHHVRSECDARTQLLARHVRMMSEQRAKELKHWTNKSQQNLRETEGRLEELETILTTKQKKIEMLEAEKITAEANKLRVKQLEAEVNEKQSLWDKGRQDNEKLADSLKKVKEDHIAEMEKLEMKLNNERVKETLRANQAEHQLKQTLQDIENLKSEFELTLRRQNDNLETEHKFFKEQLEKSEKSFECRLNDLTIEANRSEQVLRDKITLLESTVESLERNKSDVNAQLLTERMKWKEERAIVLNEIREKEEYKLSLLNEKLEHAKTDKAVLEEQLATSNTMISQLRRDNAALVAELGEVNHKMLYVQEELSSERLLVQRLRLEKNEDMRSLEASKCDYEKLRNEMSFVERKLSEMKTLNEKAIYNEKQEKEKIFNKLESKEKEISAIRAEEAERVGLFFTAFNKYFGGMQKI